MSLKPERVDFVDTSSRLLKTVGEVIKLEKVDRREWNDRFSDVYKLCVAFPEPLGDKLYVETKIFLDNHVKSLYSEVVSAASVSGGSAYSSSLLNAYHSYWLVYKEGVNYLNKLYMYLNQQHIKRQKPSDADLQYGCIDGMDTKLEIGELGLHLWRINMIEPLKDSLVTLLLKAIEELGNPSNESVVQGVILSFVHVEEYKKKGSLDLYQKIFEAPFLEATGQYYRKEAEKLLQESNCSEYIEKVLIKLDAENRRSQKYLHHSSFAKVKFECEARMVADHLNFTHGDCKRMVAEDQRKDLANMYKLLKPLDAGLSVLMKEVQEHITKVGLSSISNLTTSNGENVAQVFVENILEVHKKYSDLIRDVFNNDQQFIGALDKACSTVINHRKTSKTPCRSPEFLSRYCDSLLKRTVKGLSETEIDDKLCASITIFKYIDDKDIFQKFYAKMLAKRLIHTQSVSMESEESMINRLKNACGYEFTSKLHRMFTDIKLSDDLNNQFTTWYREKVLDLGIGFNIFVLQAGAWPLGQAAISPFNIPQPFEKSVTNFESFYGTKFNGRKLTWLHHLSTTELKISLFVNNPQTLSGDTSQQQIPMKKSYLVSMGTYHMAILSLFESVNSITYKEIADLTKLSDEQLVKHLQSLIDAKLLIVENLQSSSSMTTPDHSSAPSPPSSPSISPSKEGPLKRQNSESSELNIKTQSGVTLTNPLPDMVVTLNLNYTNKRTKFKITAVAQKEVQQQQEVSETHSSVDEDRKLYLQAAIVRIMKARKIIRHNDLIQEVISQAVNRFSPSVPMIKKCIEALMEKQYMERTSSSAEEYSYIA